MQKLIVGLLTIVALMIVWAAFIGIEPVDRRPGTKLTGTLSEVPNDWTFVDAVEEVHVETYPWWGIPLSVTVVVARDGDTLYSPSIYSEPADFPGTKFWNTIIRNDPRVHLRVEDRLFDLELRPVNSEAEFERGFRALARKYPFWQEAVDDPSKRPPMAILRYSSPEPEYPLTDR